MRTLPFSTTTIGLSRRAAARRAQAAGQTVEAHLGALDGAPVSCACDGRPRPPPDRVARRQTRTVQWRPSVRAGGPSAPQCARRTSASGSSRAARSVLRGGRRGQTPPDPVRREAHRAGRAKAVRTARVWKGLSPVSTGRNLAGGDHEHPGPRSAEAPSRRRSPALRSGSPATARAAPSAAKSAPPWEVSRPETFSMTISRGARPASSSASISRQKPKKAEERPPASPARRRRG